MPQDLAAYSAEVERAAPDPLELIKVRDIGPLFGQSPRWFYATRVRKRLYAAGFPRPVSRGTWRKRDVVAFIIKYSNATPSPPPRKRKRKPNGR